MPFCVQWQLLTDISVYPNLTGCDSSLLKTEQVSPTPQKGSVLIFVPA